MEFRSNLDEYQKLVLRMNTPRVAIDNAACSAATLVKVDSSRNHACLLDTVQLLTDLNLSISKAYVSSDGPYFMDVFHVTDRHGRKLTDSSIISYIEQSLQSPDPPSDDQDLSALELTGVDRPGLLSEVFAVLAELNCLVTAANVWAHNGRVASVIFIGDEDGAASSVEMPAVEARLRPVVGLGGSVASSRLDCHVDRRLHQMLTADRDYEGASPQSSVSVQNLIDRGYSIVNVCCSDRPKLLFDVVCALTDMNYVVFHGNAGTVGDRANQEFYIRHADGTPISSEAERRRVIQCLQAAIDRRSSNVLPLELCADDRRGLLSEVTRVFRENGLLVVRAEVSTSEDGAKNVFYVTDAAEKLPDNCAIDAVRQRIGVNCLQVKEEKVLRSCDDELQDGDEKVGSRAEKLFYFGSLVLRNLYNLGLIRSCS